MWLPETNVFNKIGNRFSASRWSGLRGLFWTERKTQRVAAFLAEELADVLKEAHDLNMIAGYRGYVVDFDKQKVMLKTPIFVDQEHLALFLQNNLNAIGSDYTTPDTTLGYHVEPVRYGVHELSEADVLDELLLEIPKSRVLRELRLTAMNDILDILEEHGLTGEGAGEDDIDQ